MAYSLDPETNRLRFKTRAAAITADGTFRITPSNNLEYWLNEPQAWRRSHDMPGKLCFCGSWRLTPNDDLELVLRSGDRLVLRGALVAVGEKEIVFEVASEDSRGCSHVRLLKLSGSWGMDDANRIVFSVTKRSKPDILTFSGSWSVNDNQQVAYRAERHGLRTGAAYRGDVVFSGYWQILAANRLRYILGRSGDSCFDVKAQIETPNIYPQKGVIKYRVGAGIRLKKRHCPRSICLYGTWRFGRMIGVSFDMEYERGTLRAMSFGGVIDVSGRDSVSIDLTRERGEPLGATLVCTRRFLRQRDARFFVRLKKAHDEKRAEAGITIPF